MEALMNAALIEAMGEWGKELERAVTADVDPEAATPIERFERFWTRVIESFATHRQVWVASFDVLAQAERAPQVRAALAEGLQRGRGAWAALLQGLDGTVDGTRAQAIGSLYQALLTGIGVQWMIDPERTPSAADLTGALRTIAASVTAAERADAG
jgi:hypothetical protein